MKTIPEILDSVNLYWLMQSILFLIVSIYIFKKSTKNVINLFFCIGLCLLFVQQIVDRTFLLIGYQTEDYLYIPLLFAAFTITHVSIYGNRYKWERMKSDKYNEEKVQKIYSKPNGLLTLLGAATSLSPKCSVRYTYNGKTIRFKKGIKTPILCDTVIKETDIIKDTNLLQEYFYKRYDEIKHKEYNLFSFNCRNLFVWS